MIAAEMIVSEMTGGKMTVGKTAANYCKWNDRNVCRQHDCIQNDFR
jgi:hypothetical protein